MSSMVSRSLKNVIHRLGYTVLRNARVEESETITDILADAGFMGMYSACMQHTMTSVSRMYALYNAIDYVVRAHIPGDIVECGVWRGGSSMLAALVLKQSGQTGRELFLYDTYEGMTEPGGRDIDRFRQPAKLQLERATKDDLIWAYAALQDVRTNLLSTGYPAEKLNFVKGKVEDTIPSTAPEQIALLRLDTDWYESTYHELIHLFPRLTAGGVLILDDYGHWAGAREAVDQYFREQSVSLLLNRIDYTGRIGIKASS